MLSTLRRATLFAVITLCLTGAAIAAPGGGRGGAKPDKAPPAVSIVAPTPGAVLTGAATLLGTASDNIGVAKIEVAVDGGSYRIASGTTAWSCGLSTTGYADGSHTLTARATDAAGNVATTAVSVTFSNAAPPPAAPADTTPPAVVIALPSAGSTVNGTAAMSGTATDNTGLAKIEVRVDGGAYQPAAGTNSWSYSLNTTTYPNGAHTIAARATDTSGNVAAASETVNIENSSTLPAGVKEQIVTPEGVTIQVYSDVSGWTAQQVYDLLKPNALELARIGPSLTIKVQSQFASSTQTSDSEAGGVYGNFKATIYLQATSTAVFPNRPDAIVAHEYGHVWTLYHLDMSHSGDWSGYLNERGIANDPRLDSSFNWSRNEMIADDYRLLFGTAAAQSEMAYVNPDVADPRTVAGLKDWFLNVWAVP
jgi:hypothetical protein